MDENRQATIHAKGFDLYNFNYANPEAVAEEVEEPKKERTSKKVNLADIEE